MKWEGVRAIVKLAEETYETRIKASEEELQLSKEFWHPSIELPLWDVTIIAKR